MPLAGLRRRSIACVVALPNECAVFGLRCLLLHLYAHQHDKEELLTCIRLSRRVWHPVQSVSFSASVLTSVQGRCHLRLFAFACCESLNLIEDICVVFWTSLAIPGKKSSWVGLTDDPSRSWKDLLPTDTLSGALHAVSRTTSECTC